MTRPTSFALSDISAYVPVQANEIREGRTSSHERISIDEIASLEEQVSSAKPERTETPQRSSEQQGPVSQRVSIIERWSFEEQEPTRKRASSEQHSLIEGKNLSIVNWPISPQKLGGIQCHLFTGDALLFLLPVMFLILAIAAYKIDGKPVSKYGEAVQQASRLGPTVYPLVFAALGGRCLKSVAVRMAERGTTIASLEKLLGSRNVVGTLGTVISLRSLDVLSVALLILWSLSPLGGQGSLRLLQTVNSTVTEPGTLFYADHQAPFSFERNAQWGSVVPGVLSASLIASNVLGSRSTDLWNHPRMPRLDALEKQNENDIRAEGPWIDVKDLKNLTYSSWTGINIQNLRSNRQSHFSIKHSYLYLNCTIRFKIDSEVALKSSNISIYPPFENNPSLATGKEKASQRSLCERSEEQGVGNFLKRGYYNNTPVTDQQLYNESTLGAEEQYSTPYNMSLLYGTIVDDTPCADIFECKVDIATVDAQIACYGDDCKVERLRRVPDKLYRAQANTRCNNLFNTLACLRNSTQILDKFVDLFANVTAWDASTAAIGKRSSNPFDDYIFDRKTSFGRNPSGSTGRFAGPPELVSERLTTVLNTYWQAGSWGTQTIKAEPLETPQYLSDSQTGNTIEPDLLNNRTTATFSRQVPVYVASIPWIVILTLTTTVLLGLGAVNLLILYSTAAPDIFEYASSLTRENPYIALPPGGTGLAGTDRSRLLRRLRVQLVDIRPEDSVGYVALKSIEEREGYQQGRLKLGRLYE